MTELQRLVGGQPLETQAFFALVDATARLVGVSERHWSSRGLHGSRIRMLVEIAKAGGSMLPSALAERIGVTKANISVLLQPLERDGYVRVADHPGDGRKRLVSLTSEGERLLLDELPDNREAVGARMRLLEEAELLQLLALLRKLHGK